jgi:hypothetical protein
MAPIRRSWSARESFPIMPAISFCDRWSIGAKAIRPFTVMDNRLCRRSFGEAVLVTNPRSAKPRRMRLR